MGTCRRRKGRSLTKCICALLAFALFEASLRPLVPRDYSHLRRLRFALNEVLTNLLIVPNLRTPFLSSERLPHPQTARLLG